MHYEVVTPADEERGLLTRDLRRAIVEASTTGGEVWQLADDNYSTRMCRVWPEPDTSQVVELGDEHAPDPVRLDVRRAERTGAELVAEYPHGTYDEIVALVAYAYMMGRRDGYAEAAALADKALAPLREAVGA